MLLLAPRLLQQYFMLTSARFLLLSHSKLPLFLLIGLTFAARWGHFGIPQPARVALMKSDGSVWVRSVAFCVPEIAPIDFRRCGGEGQHSVVGGTLMCEARW